MIYRFIDHSRELGTVIAQQFPIEIPFITWLVVLTVCLGDVALQTQDGLI